MSEQPIRSQIYVVVEAGPAAADRLAAALGAGDVASVLIRPGNGAVLDAGAAQPLVALAQGKGVAALIENDAGLARALRADGVHLLPSADIAERLEAARSLLGGRAIVGADPGRSRHDAMTLAELGADYMAFSSDGEGGAGARDELCAWWAEIFEIPCVAIDVADAEAAVALQRARCEFVGVSLPAGEPADAARARVADLARALAEDHAGAPA
ncbi:MAG: thiamine phosphate synthase [Hyphomicrobiaceae bacterium]|nr:thiamine phosphate synthase [Hyphomicrobiaceae bacterium]